MHVTQDSGLVRRAQDGDLTAVGALYDQHHQLIFRFIWSRVQDQAIAEDLTGELFTRMVIALPDYRANGVPFRAWLYRIARNLITDHHRKYGGRQAVDLAETAELSTEQDDLMQMVEAKLTAEKVRHALERIDPAQREVVELRFLVGLSLQEAAETLDKTVASVKSLQHRGLKALRGSLQALEVES